MKFFYINNSQCTDCDRCRALCPTGAVYIAQDKRYISYDKCTSCGNCIKQCTAGAITVETLAKVNVEMERVELYRSRIQTLEHELIQSRAETREIERLFSQVVMQSPIATFVVDRHDTIVIANPALTALLSVDPLQLAQMPRNLAGENIDNIFAPETVKVIRMSAADKQTQCQVMTTAGQCVVLSLFMLSDGEILGFARDLKDRAVVAEEIIARLKETIDRKMSMVQKIGFLLGEEVSVVVNNLNTVIRIVEAGENDAQSDKQNDPQNDKPSDVSTEGAGDQAGE